MYTAVRASKVPNTSQSMQDDQHSPGLQALYSMLAVVRMSTLKCVLLESTLALKTNDSYTLQTRCNIINGTNIRNTAGLSQSVTRVTLKEPPPSWITA